VYRRSRFAAVALSAFVAFGLLSQAAFAAPKDGAAKKLEKDAMDNDFITANFADAEKKLAEAIKICGASACTPKVKAMLHVHLGVVQVNAGNASAGENSFVEALKIDSSIAPEADLMENKDVEKAFLDAKKKASGGGSAATSPTTAPDSSSGELNHTPVVEQMVNTPVPIFVQVPEGMNVGKLIVMYKPFGGEWKKLELQKRGNDWTGLIPCAELGTTGDLKYYVKALDASGDQIAAVGSLNQPFVTKIKNQLDSDPPHLPKQPPPAQCAAKEDCPPGLPGCPAGPKKRGDKGWGATCESSNECQTGLICKSGQCEEGKDEGTEEGGETPGDNAPIKRNLVGFEISPDFAIISGNDVCGRDSQANKGFACFRSDGTQYHGVPIAAGNGNAIAGGIAPSTVRFMASYDRLIGQNLTIGARVGYAINGGPKPDSGNAFLPVHAELRVAYWIGVNPFARTGFRPFVFVAGGMAQVDTKVSVNVREDPTGYNGQTEPPWIVYNQNKDPIQYNPSSQSVDAWRKSGQSFAGGGIGTMYAIKANNGPVFDIKVSQMFPTAGTVISPEIGWMMGF
jgi:hypothetical protein